MIRGGPRFPAQALFCTTGVVLGLLAVAAALASSSGLVVALTLILLGGLGFAFIFRQVRRPLLAALFFLAPIDISKAVIAPLTSRYFPAGPYFSPGLYVSLAQMALLGLLLAWLGRRIVLEGRPPPLTNLDAMAFAYLAFIWLRSIGTPQGILSIGTAGSYSLSVLAFYAASHALTDRSDLRVALRASLAVLMVTLAFVVAQAVTHNPLLLPGAKGDAEGVNVSLGGAADIFRPAGLMTHPNTLAHYLVIVLPIAAAYVLMGPRRLSRSIWLAALIAGLGAGVALLTTLSRGGWAAGLLAIVVVVVIFARRRVLSRKQLGLLCVAAVIGAGALLAANPNIILRLTAPDSRSLESRVLLAEMAKTIIQANPWFGVGFGEFNRAAYQYSAPLYANVSTEYQMQLHQLVVHNHFLLFGAELGIPAILFFIYLLWRFARQAWPLSRWHRPGDLALAVGLTGAMVAQAFFLNSDNYYTDIRVFLLWLSAGMLQGLCLMVDQENRR